MRALTILLTSILPAFAADDPQADAPQNGFCIKNASLKLHLFQTETRDGQTQSEFLAPGERLCVTGSAAKDGVVRVFENADVIEGCGRIVPMGTVEALIAYAEFDRCEWRSHGF